MDREQMLREFDDLPLQAQQQVADLITFLRIYNQSKVMPTNPSNDLADEPFIGMWADREDLADSSEWVRQLREREWTPTDG